MVFGGEHHVFHAGAVHDVGPLLGIEINGIQGVLQIEIPFFVLVVGKIYLAADPVDILGAYGPRLHDAGHGVKSPVEKHAEFLVLPFVEFVENGLVGWPHISVGRGLLMYEALHRGFLCARAEATGSYGGEEEKF